MEPSTLAENTAFLETEFFKTNELLGGDATIINAKLENKDSQSQKTFTVEVVADGDYYLNAWVNSPELIGETKGKFLSYDLAINGQKLPLQFNIKKSGWHNAPYTDESDGRITVSLNKGRNQITFSCQGVVNPAIDFVRLSTEQQRANIEGDTYSKFLTNIKNNSDNKQTTFVDTTSNSNLIKTFGVEPPSDPLYDYDSMLGYTFLYTYYSTISLTSGQTAFIATSPGSSGNFTHILELFNYSNPQSYTWKAMSNSSGLASINITVPSTGTYIVRVRSYYQGQSGVVNLNINGQFFYTDCVASGSFGLRSPHNSNQVYNYFTVRSSGDPRLWIEDNSGLPGKIIGYNDDYGSNGGDFYWGLNPRIKKQYNTWVGAALVSAYSSYNPSGVADLYFRCKNSNIMSYFPNLKADDAIMSSPASSTYNCTAWAGGFTSFWFWGSTPNYYYGSAYIWSTWDNYYGNNPERYIGAMTYTASGANATNGIIAMWATPDGVITHGSIRKPGNNHAHGYDWESKPGQLTRTFHPRDALNGTSYGSIVKYYQPVTSEAKTSNVQEGLSFEESVAQGLTVIEAVELTDAEKSKIASRQTVLRNSKEMNTLYNNWMNKIKSDDYKAISNPFTFIETNEGQALLSYAKNNLEEAVLLFSSIVFDNTQKSTTFEQNISYYMFCEIAKEQYGAKMEDIKENWKRNKYDRDGKYIAPLPETFTKKYIKEILDTI